MKYFSDKTVNPGRQPEIDISKAICIVLMILIHAYMASSGGYHGIITGLLGYGAGFLGGRHIHDMHGNRYALLPKTGCLK